MIINISSRRANLKESFKERVDKKLSKLDKFFNNDAVADVIVTNEKENEREKVEVTIRSHGFVYRGEKVASDMFDSLEFAVDAIVKQIVKNKTKLAKKFHNTNLTERFDALYNETIKEPDMVESNSEEGYKIVRQKLYKTKPMLPDEAILQMNMLDHDFFVFINAETGKINIVYKRKSENYGLIIPEIDN